LLATSQNVREELTGRFWVDVHERLIEKHQRTSSEADKGIGRYRNELETHGVGDTVYNQGVARTAEIVNGLIDDRE
jgi:hypothetical protein